MGKGYFAGIDSGSTSTDVVILNKDGEIVTGIILPTGAGAAMGAERALEEALKQAKTSERRYRCYGNNRIWKNGNHRWR